MSVQGGSSEISYSGTGVSDMRYKKALKEISKLVSMNTSLKKQVDQWQKKFLKMEEDYFRLLDKFNNAASNTAPFATKQLSYSNNNDVSISPPKRVNTQSIYMDQQVYVNMEKLPASKNNNQDFKSVEAFDEQIKYLQNKIKQMQKTNTLKDQQVHQLQTALERKHLQMIQLQGRYGDVNQQLIRLKSQNKQVLKNSTNISINEQLINERKKVEQLQLKLSISEQWTKKVVFDYEQLRKRLLFSQQSLGSGGSVASLKMPNIVRLNSTQTQVSKKNQILNYDRMQLKKMQQQINRRNKEFNEKKLRYKAQIAGLKQQITTLNERIASMATFIQKQQYYIQNFVTNNSKTNKS